MMPSLHPLDYLCLGAYLVTMLGVGAAFYRRESDIGEYFVASRQMPTFVVVLGVSAALLSGISYLGSPSYAYRVNIIPFATILGMPIALGILSYVLLPFFFKLQVVTVYEYLERRFDTSIRLLSSVLFLISRMAWLALLTYSPALVLRVATPLPLPDWMAKLWEPLGVDPQIGFWVVLMGVSCTIYTMLGGMRAVMWTDVVQFLILAGGLMVVLYSSLWSVEGGLAEAWRLSSEAGRTRLLDFSFSWTDGTFWAAAVGGIFLWLGDMGTDQLTVQRYLAAKSLRHSQRGILYQIALEPVVSLLLYGVGLALFAYYQQHPDTLLEQTLQKSPDALLPLFSLKHLAPGLPGLILAAILAATMSSLTAGINSLSASTVVDLYRRYWRPAASAHNLLQTGRCTTIAWGAIITFAALFIDRLGQGLMELSYTFMGLTATLSIGIFLTAIFLPRVGSKALWCGVALGIVVTAIAVAAGIHWLWYYPLGACTLSVGAQVAAFFLPKPHPSATSGLTYWTRDEALLDATSPQPVASLTES